MKKVFFIIIVLFSSLMAEAQISGGIKGGLNFANVDINDVNDVDPDNKTGYHFGGFLEIGLAGISLMPEVLYSFKGTEDLDLTYLEVPILLKKNFAKIVNVHVGPQFGILLNDDSDLYQELSIGELEIGRVEHTLKKAELSIVVGGGVNLPFGLSAGVRYVYGLTDVNDDLNVETILGDLSIEQPEIKNRTLQLFVGYKLFGN